MHINNLLSLLPKKYQTIHKIDSMTLALFLYRLLKDDTDRHCTTGKTSNLENMLIKEKIVEHTDSYKYSN